MAAHIFIKSGPNCGEVHRLAKDSVVVGRGAECDIVIDDTHVSRTHIRIDCSGGAYRAVDLDSRNGAAFNGLPMDRKELSSGDEIRLGMTTMTFVAEGGSGAGAKALRSRDACGHTQIIDAAATVGLEGLRQFDMIGSGSKMQEVYAAIRKVAVVDTTVLISGESGTGKELVALALHRGSPRAGGAFIAVNCAAIPAELAESELFGHEKGAFTGAHAQRRGKFELAGDGTLFLDEIGDLPLDCQAKMLRVIEEKKLTRVGGERSIATNVRLVAASNRDLASLVKDGRFRSDLFYRLAVMHIQMPALRERKEDLAELTSFFLMHYCRKAGKRGLTMTLEAIARLEAYPWPGNVRELKNVIERAVIMASGPRIEVADILLPSVAEEAGAPASRATPGALADRVPRTLADVEREHVLVVLAEAGGNKTEAARRLGISKSTLFAKLKEYDASDTRKFDPVG